MSGRYCVVAVARSAQGWFAEVARWATNARVPIDLIKCMSADEVDAVLGSGRQLSALLVDAGLVTIDRDIVGRALDAGTPTLVIDDGRSYRDWESLGAAEVLPHRLDPDRLVEALSRHCVPLGGSERRIARTSFDTSPDRRASVISVTGGGGVGSSTISIAVAQALGDSGGPGGGTNQVVLVDGMPRGDQAMYHDVGDVIPGLPELVDALGIDELDPTELDSFLFDVAPRPYRLLLGTRRPREWVTLRPRGVEATFDLLERHHDVVVIDHDRDVDGEAETGSVDVEELNGVARATIGRAQLLLAVGTPGLKGMHDLARLLHELIDAGAPAERLQPVLNRAPRNPPTRANLARTLARLSPPEVVVPPIFVPQVRHLEDCHRSVRRLPGPLVRPLAMRTRLLLDDVGVRTPEDAPQLVRPGDLGATTPSNTSEVA